MSTHPREKRPVDTNELAKAIADEATDEARDDQPEEPSPPQKSPHAVALSTLGAPNGGKARRLELGAQRRKKMAKKAAKARWRKRHAR
jgi:hypothetical protein